ncbi:MAG: hypothetical protein SPF15_03035 [Candidatus Cryptobacteroides sp.]|uniref:FprA family A-type flavoprotein n=1 Tax=Candidatus Cryptobacteroides sp. TaxID=2952915 RepID=UPI002A807F76|nr:hypothetical protein [Candidatus Cryptobacteroides sp.]MDY5042964.1 hypothetical protein [Candidatus Cryptobacteroides sp.]
MDSKYITYIGVDDVDIDLFESQYVVPEGMCYDSYLVKGDRIAVMDTVDARMAGEWMTKLSAALGGRKPDYLVLQHMEPDHSGAVMAFLNEYPDTTIVCSQQAANFLLQFNETLRAEIRPLTAPAKVAAKECCCDNNGTPAEVAAKEHCCGNNGAPAEVAAKDHCCGNNGVPATGAAKECCCGDQGTPAAGAVKEHCCDNNGTPATEVTAKECCCGDQGTPAAGTAGLRAEIRTVKEGDCLELGEGAELQFIAAPMVHWPEVMMTWFAAEKTLFSADGFGKFGVYDADPDDWACEARRYYFNICGKYGAQVAKVLQKAARLDIQRICPLHGPVLTGDRLAEAVRLYTVWSSYKPETPEGILIAYASIHGNTAAAARRLANILEAKGAPKVAVTDLCRDDVAEAIEDAFRMGTMVLACSTYDGGIFPPMKCFLDKLAMKGFCDRRVALVENGTWAPLAAKLMRASLESMKSIDILDRTLTIKSSLKESQVPELEALADLLLTPSSK